ncbi:MAG: L,D-transpeptidase family protein [Pseudomonadota bacterium]
MSKATMRVFKAPVALVAGIWLFAGQSPSTAEVPVPRIAPKPGVVVASLSDEPPESLSPAQAIKREATVDVSIAVSAFYAEREFAPLWPPERAEALRARLSLAAFDGLDPADYFVPRNGLSPAALDVSLTEAALRYANDAYSGKLTPSSVSPIMTVEPPVLDEARFLRRLGQTKNIARTLDRLSPQHPGFVALKAKLAEALNAARDQRVAIGRGKNLRRGTKGVRVAALRSRLNATVSRGADPTVFDDTLDEAVRAYQTSSGLKADGIVGPRTIAMLDEGVGDHPVASLVSNMERWRWLPRGLGGHHVVVNIPSYRVKVQSAGSTIYDGRVIVGAAHHPTPVFSDEIEHIVVNPYWNVPVSIASKEMLRGIMANPAGYLSRRNYEAVMNGRVVNPSSISWSRAALSRVRIRQRPGRGNALGAVKFMFPNKHAVDLHDTPTKHLFRRDRRAFSHGCIRVHNPFDFAQALLSKEEKLSGAGLKRMVGGKQRWLKLDRHVPVHLTYFTREVTADGKLVRYADVYGYDRRVQRALNKS